MKFRPCIDIHNGKVKQIVGGSLRDRGDQASENFVSEMNADYYADFYARDGLKGGHIILLNPRTSPYYEATKAQAMLALHQTPGIWQVGGGIQTENAAAFLDAGASGVIVTSYVFRDGKIDYAHLEELFREVGKEKLILDLSCRKRNGEYYIVTDRWQKFTEVCLNQTVIKELAAYCREFLIHAADVEGKAHGIEKGVAELLGTLPDIPSVYAGGVGSYQDLLELKALGQDHVDVTIGSALDLFGGKLSYRKILELCENRK